MTHCVSKFHLSDAKHCNLGFSNTHDDHDSWNLSASGQQASLFLPMTPNDLLRGKGFHPEKVLVLRHRPTEPQLNKVLPWLAAERPETFNTYQQTQSAKLEKAMLGGGYIASFLGHEAGKALFVGRAHKNEMPVRAVLEDSALDKAMPSWDEISLTWEELSVLPTRWRSALSQWRGIYYIFDSSDGKGYVGSAYSKTNLLGRWLNYAASGHGGNSLLRKRDPKNFRFTILQRVST